MNDRHAWNENARAVQGYHRGQDAPALGWKQTRSLAGNLLFLACVTTPFILLVDWAERARR